MTSSRVNGTRMPLPVCEDAPHGVRACVPIPRVHAHITVRVHGYLLYGATTDAPRRTVSVRSTLLGAQAPQGVPGRRRLPQDSARQPEKGGGQPDCQHQGGCSDVGCSDVGEGGREEATWPNVNGRHRS